MFASEWTLGKENAREALEIRRKVFAEDLGQAADAVYDSNDYIAAHLLVRLDGVPIASARLYPAEGGVRFEYIGVLKEYRKQRFGDLCVRLLLYKAQQMGVPYIYALVPEEYILYYAAFGFKPQGAPENGFTPVAVAGDAVNWHSACQGEA